MYGPVKTPFREQLDNERIDITRIRGGYLYIRKNKETKDENRKRIATKKGKIRILPVEPVNLPRFITPYLMIEYLEPMLISPKGESRFYVKFPVEIGALVFEKETRSKLDIFTLVRPKYTLYGDVETGIICRYYQSKAYPRFPKADPLREGVMEIKAVNSTPRWLEMKRGVFNAVNMKIFHSSEMVSMRALIRLLGEDRAENHFFNKGLIDGMEKSVELFNPKITMIQPSFKMESGI